MKTTIARLLLLASLITLNDNGIVGKPPFMGECTIGVFSGRATSDGRPLLWKNRDVTNGVQKFCYYRRVAVAGDTTMEFIANAYSRDTTRFYMGLNEAGFAVMNSNTYNLGDVMNDGVEDGQLMKMALESCRTIADFEHILEMTSLVGRKDCWNFGAIDAFGGAAMYECSNRSFAKFDANDTLLESNGVVLRATFSFTGGDSLDGFARYKRATHLLTERLRQARVDVPFILGTMARDLCNPLDDPYPLPYDGAQEGRPAGFIQTRNITINRDVTRSLIIVRGIRPGESPKLATMYGMIGPPVLSVAFPMWVESHSIPTVLNSGTNVPMYTQITRRIPKLYPIPGDNTYLNSRYLIGKDGIGLYTYTLPLEERVLQRTEQLLNIWRYEIPSQPEFLAAQNALADTLYMNYLQIPLTFTTEFDQPLAGTPELINYPNPFNAQTSVDLSGFAVGEQVDVTIYNVLGQEVMKLRSTGGAGNTVLWDGRDESGNGVSSGIYFINAAGFERTATTKALLMK